MDRARKIALKHSQQLVDYANAECDRIDAETDKRLAALEAKVADRKKELENKPSEAEPTDKWGRPLYTTYEPPAGSWAATARMMAQNDDSGFDWDAWKNQMKEGRL